MNKNRPIGIFDSGLGGLTVLQAFRSRHPAEDFIYLADTKNVPYGDKSPETIRDLALKHIEYLVRRNVKCVAFGCNTSSAVAIEEAQKKYPDVIMLGLLSPALAEEARKDTKGRIGVIATTATVQTGRYPLVLQNGAQNIDVFMCACPRFVPLIESGRLTGPEVDEAIESSLDPLVSAQIDTMVYGCSHFPFLAEPIQKFFQKKNMSPRLVDPAGPAAASAKTLFRKSQLDNIRVGNGYVRFVVTGSKPAFKQNLKTLGVPFYESMVFAPTELDEEPDPIR
ncbi:glutamate racemase [bacterium]|nr:glutamate racemase [bacterium]